MPAVTAKVPGAGTNTLSFTVPLAGLDVESVVALVDASGAAGPITAELTITDQSGVVIANKPQVSTILNSGTGSATWALRLDDNAGGSSTIALLTGTSVTRSLTSQTITNALSTNLHFDTVVFDDLGWFNPTFADEIKVSLTGVYLVVYTTSWVYPAGGGFSIQTGIGQSGPLVATSTQVTAVAASPNTTSGANVVAANAGDVFTMFLYQASGGNMSTWIAGSHGGDVQAIPTMTVLLIH